MKKLVCLLTVAALLIANPFYAYAINDAGVTDDITIFTPDSFQALFGAQTLDEVRYNDLIDVIDTDEAYVETNIRLTVGNTYYYGSASGLVKLYQASESYTLWQGGLDGIITVNGVAYLLNVGYSRVAQTGDVQLCCTIQNIAGNLDDNVLFATSVIHLDEEVTLNNLYNTDETESPAMGDLNYPGEGVSVAAIIDPITPVPGDGGGGGSVVPEGFLYKGLDDVYFTENGYPYGGYACTTWVHISENLDSVVVGAVPYVTKINEHYENIGGVVETELDYIVYSLSSETTSGDSGCEIIGIKNPGYDTGVDIELSPVFEDLMGKLGIPTSTISAVLDLLSGSVEIVDPYINYRTVKVTFALGSSVEYAESRVQLPVEFGLTFPSGSDYDGGAVLTASNIIKYRTVIIYNDPNALPTWISTTTQATNVEFGVN